MALSGSEQVDRGFVRTLSGELVVTTDTTDAVYAQGFLRDPDLRLVVVDG